MKDFEKKFSSKTKNKWANRDDFKPSPGKYTLLEIVDEEEEDEVDAPVSLAVDKIYSATFYNAMFGVYRNGLAHVLSESFYKGTIVQKMKEEFAL